jgi:hypothetical protein
MRARRGHCVFATINIVCFPGAIIVVFAVDIFKYKDHHMF